MNREPKVQGSRVNITKYVKVPTDAGEGWRFCPVVRSSNGRIRADYVLVDGRTEFHKEGAYYIDWYEAGRRRRESHREKRTGCVCRGGAERAAPEKCSARDSGSWRRQPEADDAVRSVSIFH